MVNKYNQGLAVDAKPTGAPVLNDRAGFSFRNGAPGVSRRNVDARASEFWRETAGAGKADFRILVGRQILVKLNTQNAILH